MTDRERWLTCTDPAWMLNALGDAADERRRIVFANSITSMCTGHECNIGDRHSFGAWIEVDWGYITSNKSMWPHATEKDVRCDLIRCLWPSPSIERELVECESENCSKISPVRLKSNWHWECEDCNGKGCTLAPLINPRWRTPLVMDLARQVRGGTIEHDDLILGGKVRMSGVSILEPNPELMPILADALQDPPACCDMPEIIEHLRCGVHVPGECWVVSELMRSDRT